MAMIEHSESEKPMAPPSANFSAPFASPSLRWASKKRLRCFPSDAAVTALRHSPSPSPDRPPRPRPRFPSLNTTVPFPDTCAAASPFLIRSPASEAPPPSFGRARTPTEGDGGEPPITASPDGSSRAAKGIGWSLRSGVRNGEAELGKKKKKRRVELWVSLSRDEIEEDFLWMTGAKPPPRRSRRCDKSASHHLLLGVFPGSWLPNKVTAARYRVAELSEPRKVRRASDAS